MLLLYIGQDYRILDGAAQLHNSIWIRNMISIQIDNDNTAAESMESVCLQLTALRPVLLPNEFLRDNVCINIKDSTGKVEYLLKLLGM